MHPQITLQHPPIAPWVQHLALTCRVQLFFDGDASWRIYLRAEPDNEELLVLMKAIGQQAQFTVYEAEFPWDDANPSHLYVFKLVSDTEQGWFAADGLHTYMPPRDVHFKVARLSEHQPPAWIYEQVFYQIFPDRFYKGDMRPSEQTNLLVNDIHQQAWGAPIDQSHTAQTFYGGDLLGIQKKLDYLNEELGVTALYLNPIFSAGSNHRYDTDDYFQVDARLGGNQAFADLVAGLRERGMKIILDAVVNHTSDHHPWFNRDGRHGSEGAFQDKNSPYRHWYNFSAEHDYTSWKGHQHLPVLNMASPAVQIMVYQGEQSILRFWMRAPYAIDGWRFDVLHMLGEGTGARNNAHYVREFRRVMREENSQAFVLGEQFNEATRWLQGEQEDGAMNYYGFAHPVRAWLAHQDIVYDPIQIDSQDFDDWLTQTRARIPYTNQLAQLNLLDSHDTVRFLTLLRGNTERMKLAVVLLMTYPGMPCIYYGDEIGMEGGNDPDCRRCFNWDREHWNHSLFHAYQQLIRLRRLRAELQCGAMTTLVAQGNVFVFARYTAQQVTLVALNRGADACTIDLSFEQQLGFLAFPAAQWQCATWQDEENSTAVDDATDQPVPSLTPTSVWPQLRLAGQQAQIWLNQSSSALS